MKRERESRPGVFFLLLFFCRDIYIQHTQLGQNQKIYTTHRTWKASTTSRTVSTSATTTTATTPRIVLLGREQTEEWKGWMQYMFIFYHYYRVYGVYNEIRVFVSAYVWMVRTHTRVLYCCACVCVFDCWCWGEKCVESGRGEGGEGRGSLLSSLKCTREEGVWVIFNMSCFFSQPPQLKHTNSHFFCFTCLLQNIYRRDLVIFYTLTKRQIIPSNVSYP